MWTFFVTCVEEAESIAGVSYPQLVFSHGVVPDEARKKHLSSQRKYSLTMTKGDGKMKATKMINGINHCEASHGFRNSASQIQTLLAQFHPY